MGGRWVDRQDDELPLATKALLAKVPACFEAPTWRMYVVDCARGTLEDRPNRKRVLSGEPPRYCLNCTAGFRAAMQEAGRCHPPHETAPQGAAEGSS